MAQTIKNLPAMRKTQVQTLDWEDLLEDEMTTHSSILAWRIPWTEEPGGLRCLGLQRVIHHLATNFHPRSVSFNGRGQRTDTEHCNSLSIGTSRDHQG